MVKLRSKSTSKKIQFKKSRLSPSLQNCLLFAATIVLLWGFAALAQDASQPIEAMDADVKKLKVALDTIWVIFTACLVFFMNAGFGMLEAGFCRQKNTVNILAKNLIVFALSTIAFWITGFAIMFGDGTPFFGTKGFLVHPPDAFSSLDWTVVPLNAKFFFQLVFAGTAATIVSGAVAERIKFGAFIIFSLFLVAIAYPITGHWIWGGGWLQNFGFWDFAGSTVVHSVGGWAALTGAFLLGPRIGKFQGDESLPLPGHNLSISTLGCLILWLGWFGFNPGSTMAADAEAITHILLTTNLAAATGAFAATLTSWQQFGKPDLTMIINGVLAGLVAITAPCAFVSLWPAAIIGAIAGIIVVFSVDLFDRWKIDDPVGAISVHLVCGIWGTLAVGLFSAGPGILYSEDGGPMKGLLLGGSITQLMFQLVGITSVGLLTVLLSGLAWYAMKSTVGIRVSREAELKGLDVSSHGMAAYSDFSVKQVKPSKTN